MAKTRTTSANTGQSSGELRAADDDLLNALKRELEIIGRRPYPLDPGVLIRHDLVLGCPAVVARAGPNAPRDLRAKKAGDVLREIIATVRDDTDRWIAEAALAANSGYEGKRIYERQELLVKEHGITKDIYADHRISVFWKLVYALRAPLLDDASSLISPSVARVASLHPSQVGALATRLYYMIIATKVLTTARLRLLGGDALLLREPNLPFYSLHVTFLLIAHRYLHTMTAPEKVAKPDLADIYQRIVASGPLPDIVYLAHIYGGRDEPEYPPGAPNDKADRLLRLAWKEWYERQEWADADIDSDLDLMAIAVGEFRDSLPTLPQLQPDDKSLLYEIKPAVDLTRELFRRATIYKPPLGENAPHQPPLLSDVLTTPDARDTWVREMIGQLQATVRSELRKVKGSKAWDPLIADSLHREA